MTLITPKSQTILVKTKDAPKIHIVDFKKIQEEKQKKNESSRVFIFKSE
jgi:hypothetical protein